MRHYINNTQINWVSLLLMTQLTLNIKQFDTTKATSFFANYERNSNLFDYKESPMLTNIAKSRVEMFKEIHENIIKMQNWTFNYINKKRKNASLLKEGNKIYLFTKNLKRKDKRKKLNFVKIEAFFIKKIKKLKNYELNLLKNAKVHLIFNISLLKSIDFNTFIQETFHYEKQKKKEFEIKKILKEKKDQYLIKWKSYDATKNI